MTPTTGTFAFDAIPSGLAQVDGTVLGTPLIIGTTETYLSVVSADGQDRKPFTWVIITSTAAPLPPTNLVVNGSGGNPTYQSGESLTIQWSITSDGLDTPSSLIELRKFDGQLVSTITVAVGVNIFTLLSTDILSLFGANQNIIVQVFALRNSVRSTVPAECTVTYVN
jgi:hypothetical protein